MPKRNRTKEQRANGGHVAAPPTSGSAPAAAAAESEQARAARLFAQSVKDHAAADQRERERQDSAAAQVRRGADLLAAKDAAAVRLKRLRAEGRPRQQMAEADAAYRLALAALTEFETGERPHWAPAVPEPEPESDSAVEPDSDAETEDGSGQPS